MPVDYYEALGVSREANDEEIRRAFRRKAMEFHPDRNRTPGAEDKFKEINEAYQVLGDQEKRARYDRFGHAGVNGGGSDRPFDGFDPFGGFGDIFDTFFGGGGQQRANRARPGEDITQRITLSFEEAVFGCERDIEINRVEPCRHCSGAGNEPGTPVTTCATCHGSGQVRRAQRSVFGQFAVATPCGDCRATGRVIETPCRNCRARGVERRQRTRAITIPAGIENGMQVRVTGEGDAGSNGGPPGNLYVQVRVLDHPVFVRDGFDLVCDLSINMAEAALGVTKPAPTLEGEEVPLEIPAGAKSGSYFRLRGRGIPHLRRDGRMNNRRGDIRVIVTVDIPARLNKYQRELLENLAYSFEHGGKAPPAPAKPKAAATVSGASGQGKTKRPRNRRQKASARSTEPAAASPEPDDAPPTPAAGATAPDEKQPRGLFDRIKDTFSPPSNNPASRRRGTRRLTAVAPQTRHDRTGDNRNDLARIEHPGSL